MLKFVMMPPQDDLTRHLAQRLEQELLDYYVVMPETDDEACRQIVEADAAYGWVPPEALKKAARLRWLQNPHAGPFPGYYYPELIAHPVVVCNPRGIYSDHISHHVMMFVLALARGLSYYYEAQQQQRWDKDARKSRYVDLTESTALIVGVGGIGYETALLCAAFNMTVLGVDARPEREAPVIEMHPPSELDALLPRADFVITTTPHTPQTEGMWHAGRFEAMKDTAYFINVGRGMTTKLDDLADAIDQGEIAGCGLDVFEVEPLPASHRLWTMPNVLLTPHIAIRDAPNIIERRLQLLLDNARRFAVDEPLRNVVDKAAWY